MGWSDWEYYLSKGRQKTKEDEKEEESWMGIKVGQGQQSLGELTLAEIFTHINLKV